MKRRLWWVAGLSAVLLVTLAPGAAVGRSPEDAGIRRLDAASLARLREVEDLGPTSLAARRPVTVLLELEGPSVAELQAVALERNGAGPLPAAEREAIGQRIAVRQRALRPRIQSLGGRILGTYQHAVNGIKVRLAPGKLDELARLPGVERVHEVPIVRRDLVHADRFVKAPPAWTATGRTGAGVTIAVIDSGIDYTHANFGGSGRPADFASDDGRNRRTGHAFPTAKVINGWDFAGDAYDPDDPQHSTPAPDDDPLDCAVRRGGGHGTHVAGIAAGFGVQKVGGVESTYSGAYNRTAFDATRWVVAPGVAPRAKLVALRVFGCTGGTDLVVDAIEQAVTWGVDVINLSLGGYFARPDDIISIAIDAASKAGIVVVGAAGNSGASAYIHGGVATATSAISVGAVNAVPSLPRAIVKAVDRKGQIARNMNASVDLPRTAPLHVVGHPGMSEGCAASDYAAFPAGRIAVVRRGGCPLIDKGGLAQAAGAVGIVVVNDSAGLPPYLGAAGPWFSIPMLGVRKKSRPLLITAHGSSTTLKPTTPSANRAYRFPAAFSSGGPRNADSALKPELAAPGVDVISAAAGTGTRAVSFSGTSMASPVVAGAAALIIERWPTWLPADVKAVLLGTAAAGKAKFAPGQYDILLSGAGSVNARKSADAVAFARTAAGDASLSFGYDQIGAGGYEESLAFQLYNRSNRSITYSLSSSFNGPSRGATLTLSTTSITVPAHASRSVRATLRLGPAAVADLPDALVPADVSVFGQFYQPVTTIKGIIRATPSRTGAGRYPLRVPFLAVPRGVSDMIVTDTGPYAINGDEASFSASIRNTGAGGHRGAADVYAWGLTDSNEGYESSDIRAVGVQSFVCDHNPQFDCAADDRLLGFAVNTWGRWSNMSTEEFDVLIDTDADDAPDFAVFSTDFGLATGAGFDGTGIVLTCSLDPDGLCDGDVFHGFFVDPAPNGSTAWLPTVGSWLGLSSSAGRFRYTAAGVNVIPHGRGLVDRVQTEDGSLAWAAWNPWHVSVNQGDYYPLLRGQSQPHTFRVFRSNMHSQGAPMGWLVVGLDDGNGESQADVVPLGTVPPLP